MLDKTISYKAINNYKKIGFDITDEKGLNGYENRDYEKSNGTDSKLYKIVVNKFCTRNVATQIYNLYILLCEGRYSYGLA